MHTLGIVGLTLEPEYGAAHGDATLLADFVPRLKIVVTINPFILPGKTWSKGQIQQEKKI